MDGPAELWNQGARCRRGKTRLAAGLLLFALATAASASEPADSQLGPETRVRVRAFTIEGNTVFDDATLTTVVEPWLGVQDANALLDARDALSEHYHAAGYVTSGALLPAQDVRGGVVRLRVVEGRLADVEITGVTSFSHRYLRERLGVDGPLDIARLRERIERLDTDPRIARVDARIEPSVEPGEARLVARVDDAPRVRATASVDNHRSPGIGATRAMLQLEVDNLIGHADTLEFAQALHPDTQDRRLAWSGAVARLPAGDARLRIAFERTRARVEAEAFRHLDIESESTRASAAFELPLRSERARQVRASLGFRVEQTRTFVGGDPFAFDPVVDDDGRARVVTLSSGVDWLRRSDKGVLALRTQLDFGLDALGATGKVPKFVVWRGQAQWLHNLQWRDANLLLRASAQLASRTLAPSQRFAVGGRHSVRGYRESTLTRDSAVLGSLEARVPIGRLPLPGITVRPTDGMLELAAFADIGHGWNRSGSGATVHTLASVGLGLRYRAAENALLELYLGHPLRNAPTEPDHDLQDDGVHFSLRISMSSQ